MPKRSSKTKVRKDINILAAHIVEEATGESSLSEGDIDKNPHAVALGRLGGLKGGRVRASRLTPERRREIARKAAQARWQNREH